MQIEATLHIVDDNGETITDHATVLTAIKRHDQLVAIGLPLDEGREPLANVQQRIVAAQAEVFVAGQRHCVHCGQPLRHKDHTTRTFRTPFGNVPIDSPRLYRCYCEPAMAEGGPQTFSPLTALLTTILRPRCSISKASGRR